MKRLTKIVCTLGPTSETKEQIQGLADEGMNVARINMSHGSPDEYEKKINTIRQINDESTDHDIAILLDTKGAEIRTGVVDEKIEVKEGDEILLCPPETPKDDAYICLDINYKGFSKDVLEADAILIDNGELSFELIEVRKDGTVLCKAKQEGLIGSRRHVNLPGANVDLPSITDKDWQDISFAAEHEVDYLALSFIRNADEVREVREFLKKKGSVVRLITKVETRQAADDIVNIIEASDGVMVARGDLGAEVPFEQIPALQDEMVARCIDAGKPVIVATHMLESMIESPIPTRAEMTDVSHAAVTLADATMLSGETANGHHPRLVVNAMSKLLRATEEHIAHFMERKIIPIHDNREAKAEAAVNLADSIDAAALIVFTRSGDTAQNVSKFRPTVPVIACSETPSAVRRMALMYGVNAIHVDFDSNEQSMRDGIAKSLELGLIEHGQQIVMISNISTEADDVWSIQVRDV